MIRGQAVYQSLLHLSWVDNLLTAVRALFTKQYATELKNSRLTKLACTDFDQTFDALVRRLDTGSTRRQSEPDSDAGPVQLTPPSSSVSAGEEAVDEDEPPPPPIPAAGPFKKPASPQRPKEAAVIDDTTNADVTPVPTPETSRPSTPLQQQPPTSQLLTAKAAGPGKGSRRARKANAAAKSTSAPASSGDESPARKSKGGKGSVKQKRRWDADGGLLAGAEGDDTLLDYSATPAVTSVPDEDERDLDINDVKAEQMGKRTGKGEFVLKDLDDEIDAILATQTSTATTNSKSAAESESSGLLGSATSRISGLFRNVVGGKTLSKQDLQQPLQQMQTHLLEKNVAREAAERLCSAVEADLLDQKTASFTSIDKTIHSSMAKALTRILTPTSSLDLLRDITDTTSGPEGRPYVISIVGVNGVGKSTNLSKIAYFLLQNHFRVLVVAADTFRSGAVEQLRVHVRNLSELSQRENVGTVELFEKGYGKDAATVARDAVTYASKSRSDGDGRLWDVVLIDTAGRRHNDTRLMSSLTKFGQLAKPDKIFMVGEALVGTDSVAQARNFAKEFVDTKVRIPFLHFILAVFDANTFVWQGQLRNNGVGMDGFIISKCDTVGDMVGTLVSMVHATGIPVVFLGVGQHYGDLRGLNVGWAVDKLMR